VNSGYFLREFTAAALKRRIVRKQVDEEEAPQRNETHQGVDLPVKIRISFHVPCSSLIIFPYLSPCNKPYTILLSRGITVNRSIFIRSTNVHILNDTTVLLIKEVLI